MVTTCTTRLSNASGHKYPACLGFTVTDTTLLDVLLPYLKLDSYLYTHTSHQVIPVIIAPTFDDAVSQNYYRFVG